MEYIDSEAFFNHDQTHRYFLGRVWRKGPQLLFIMLNPSKAGKHNDDQTIKSCVRIANHNGFGGIGVVNLFSMISTVADVIEAKIGIASNDLEKMNQGKANNEFNDQLIRNMINNFDQVVCAWGNWPFAETRVVEIKKILFDSKHKEFFALRITKSGRPYHPLYLPEATKPIQYFLNRKIELQS
jgi:hypothetical protein